MRNHASTTAEKRIGGRIIATDIDPAAVEAATQNATTAGVERFIDFGVVKYAETRVPEGARVIVFNPEYGERMGVISELEETYKGIGDFLKQKCRGDMGYLFTGNVGLAKKIGLKPKRRLPFFNGPIQCRLLEYELYEGSRA